MISGRTIIGVGSGWSAHPTSKYHVMRRLAEDNHVVWVNYHASRRPSLNRNDLLKIVKRVRQACSGIRQVQSTIDVLSPMVLPWPESSAVRFFNARLIARQVNGVLGSRPQRPVQLWLFTPDIPELIDLVETEAVVYYCVDDFAAFSGFNSELIARLEKQTCRKADTTIATSQTLLEHCRNLHPNAQLVLHGVDVDHFASAFEMATDRLPEDVRNIPGPVFGYFGLLSDYVDLDLIATAARRRPDWSFVLLGSRACDVSVLEGIKNVHLLGNKAYEELPDYCRAFDVGLIPFRMNRLTRSVNPIKLREYLAAGLPVVSSPMPEVFRYRSAVYTAETPDEFISACQHALAAARSGPATQRRDLVRAESWQARVEQLSEIVHGDKCRTQSCAPATFE